MQANLLCCTADRKPRAAWRPALAAAVVCDRRLAEGTLLPGACTAEECGAYAHLEAASAHVKGLGHLVTPAFAADVGPSVGFDAATGAAMVLLLILPLAEPPAAERELAQALCCGWWRRSNTRPPSALARTVRRRWLTFSSSMWRMCAQDTTPLFSQH